MLRRTSLLAITLLLAASTAFADEPKYRIGVLLPLTGNFASYGKLVRESVEMVKNPSVEWVFEDEVCEPAKAVAAYKKLLSVDHISFIIGPCCGSPQKAIAPLLKNQSQLILLPNAAPASLFEESGRKMYSVQYSLQTDGAFIASEMNKRGLKKAAVVYVDTDFSQSLEAGFSKAFEGKVVYTMRAAGFDPSYMKAAAVKLKNTDFDSVFIPDAAPLLLGFLTELKKLGVAHKPAFSVYAAQMPDVLASEKESAEGLLYSYPDILDSADAFGYFPQIAAKLLSDLVAKCQGAYQCVADTFSKDPSFQSDGTLRGGIRLKTVRNGKFSTLN
jgi:ABC-type branched-subunit amino acid transport system substrate-binding protein